MFEIRTCAFSVAALAGLNPDIEAKINVAVATK
jgi:hypothetical protein